MRQPGLVVPRGCGGDRGGEVAGERPDGQGREGDRGQRQAVPRAEVRHRQVHGSREGGDGEQTGGGGPVRIPLGRYQGGGDGGGRTGAEPADHRARDDGGHGRGQRGGAVAEQGQGEAEPGESAGSDPFDPRGQDESGGRRTQQQRTADGTGLCGGERKARIESADGGRQQIRSEVPGREKGNEGPGGGAGGEHGRSQGMRKERKKGGGGDDRRRTGTRGQFVSSKQSRTRTRGV